MNLSITVEANELEDGSVNTNCRIKLFEVKTKPYWTPYCNHFIQGWVRLAFIYVIGPY